MIKKGFVKEAEQNWYYEYHQLEGKTQESENITLVLLHEGLGSVAQWKDWPRILREKLQMNILVYDRSGYGKSSPAPSNYPKDYLRHEANVVFPKILSHLNISKVHLFGHSDGATIALLAAAYHPHWVLSVISEAAHVIIEEISIQGIRETRKNYLNKLQRPLRKYHGEKTDWVFYHWADTWLEDDFKHWEMIKELQQIKCPVLAIQGQLDEYGSLAQLKTIDEACSAEIHHLENCGHHPHFEQKETIIRITKSFYQSI